MWVYLWALYSIPLIHVSGFVPVPYFLTIRALYTTQIWFWNQEARRTLALYILNLFGYLGSSVVPYKFWDYLFCEKCNGYFDSDCTEHEDYFGLYGHFNNVNSFISVVYFSIY